MPRSTEAGARRTTLGFLAVVLWPGLLVLDTALAVALGWRPPERRYLPAALPAAAAVLLAGLLVACGALLTRRGAACYRRHATQLALAAASLALGTVAVEGLAGAFFDRLTLVHRRPPHLERVFRAREDLFAGVQGDARYSTNSLGVRASEWPARAAARRILCVGGSAVECVYLDDAQSFPHLLEQELNAERPASPVWAGGVGISGFTTQEHLEFMQRSKLPAQVDDLVFLVGFNDAGRVVIGAAELGPAPLWRRSAFVGLGLSALRRRAERRLIDQLDAFGDNIRAKRLRRQRAGRTQDLPDLDAPLRDYAARLRALAALARAQGARPTFVTQPVLYAPEAGEEIERRLWLGETAAGTFVTAPRLRQAMDAYNDVLLRVCAEVGAGCVDLREMNGRPEYFFDDCHFNAAGSAHVARRLAGHFAGWR
jgi:lysophospholipase L1-like esterase